MKTDEHGLVTREDGEVWWCKYEECVVQEEAVDGWCQCSCGMGSCEIITQEEADQRLATKWD